MKKDNLVIYVSSKNNYDMLSAEVFKNIDFEGFEFINVDDNLRKMKSKRTKNLQRKIK